MTDNIMQAPRTSRRSVLRGAVSMAAIGLFAPAIARAQGRELNFWTTQRAPAQGEAYAAIWDAFTQETGYKVNVTGMTEEEYLPRLSAALAAGSAPDLMSHMPPPFVIELHGQKLLAPIDEVVRSVGEEDFYENSRELIFDKEQGMYPAIAIVNSTTTGPLWYRKDLLAKAGLSVPTDWASYLDVAEKTTGRGYFGNVYPFGKTSMGDKLFLQTIWQAGGTVFNPDLTLAMDSDQVVAALEFVANAIKFSPPSSVTYAYAETINAFTQGRVTMAPYSGRVLSNMVGTAPQLADQFSVTPFPHRAEAMGGKAVYVGDFQSLAIPSGAADLGVSREMALHLFKPEHYIRFLHAVPGHNLPNLRSIAESDAYKDNELLKRFATESETMNQATVMSRDFLRETPDHQLNKNAGRVLNSRVLVETIHDVVIGGKSPREAAGACVDKIAQMIA